MGGVLRGEVVAVIDRINASDPDAVTLLLWIVIFTLLVGAYLLAARITRKRNRWLPSPRPDGRSSIEYSKPHMPKRER